jgi:hypothetical protein
MSVKKEEYSELVVFGIDIGTTFCESRRVLRIAVGLDLIDLFNPDSWRGIVMASHKRRDVGRTVSIIT